jgi:putative transposase
VSRHYKIRDQQKLYFVSFAAVNWIDMFIRREYKDIVVDSLSHGIRHKGLEGYAWCLMSSHVHLIIGTTGEKIADILRDLKRHTAKALLKAIAEHSQESRREWMLGRDELVDQKLHYVHQNPVEAGWVEEPEHYLYSSARDYAGVKGLVKVKLLE